MQPALVYTSKSKERKPLLVALHTWSGNYKQAGSELNYAHWCVENDWNMIHPHFRGPNNKPQALGSDLVVADISSAVTYMLKNHKET